MDTKTSSVTPSTIRIVRGRNETTRSSGAAMRVVSREGRTPKSEKRVPVRDQRVRARLVRRENEPGRTAVPEAPCKSDRECGSGGGGHDQVHEASRGALQLRLERLPASLRSSPCDG